MTTTTQDLTTDASASRTPAGTPHAEAARDHLWMHFTRHSVF